MIRVAINGFGRIGRLAFRRMFEDSDFEIVAINDLTDNKTLSHLLKYDTAQGRYKSDKISYDEENIIVDNKKIRVYAESDPSKLPWRELNIDVVLECTGFFTSKDKAKLHIDAGAKKVVISAPAGNDVKTIVYNVNHNDLTKSDEIISAASCTTNCLAPIAKVLNDNFGIKMGYMSTIHAYTNDQNNLDAPHKKGDLRRARASASNIVPSSTGAAKAIGLVIPELNGKLDGSAQRVPVISGSLIELYCILEKETKAEEINNIFKEKQNETLGYTDEEIVSSDVIGITYGSLFDSTQTKILNLGGTTLIKLVSWYDNEMSYTSQMVRTIKHLGTLI